MRYHPDKKELSILCESLQKDVDLCYIDVTDTGTGPGGNDKFNMTLRFSDKSMEYVYFSQRFAAQEWYDRITKIMKKKHKNAVVRKSWAAAKW